MREKVDLVRARFGSGAPGRHMRSRLSAVAGVPVGNRDSSWNQQTCFMEIGKPGQVVEGSVRIESSPGVVSPERGWSSAGGTLQSKLYQAAFGSNGGSSDFTIG